MWIRDDWNKLKLLWQDASYRRLAFALAISVLLHLILIGKFDLSFPKFNEQHDLIEARLLLSKPILNPAQKSPEEKKFVENKVAQKKLEKPVEKSESLSKIVPDLAELQNPAPSETEDPQEEEVPLQQPEVGQVDEVQPKEESSFGIKPQPYQYIESEFDVYTDKEDVTTRTVAGVARSTYQRTSNGKQYQIRNLIQAKGLVSLIVPDLLQTSEGYFDEVGLQPKHYLYQFGDKKDKTFSADFNWSEKKLILHSEKGDQSFDLQEGTQDLLSFMYQFMFVPPLQNMQLNITNGKKLGMYDYTFEGEETLATKIGDLKTIHILRTSPETEKKTELWLAIDYQYVPVKIRETSGNGKMYELLINRLNARLDPLPPA